jgi:hypothetical protein
VLIARRSKFYYTVSGIITLIGGRAVHRLREVIKTIKNVQCDNKGCDEINSLNAEFNTTCYLLALLGAHHIFHVRRARVKMQHLLYRQKFIQNIVP